MNIIQRAFDMALAVERFIQKVKHYFYIVMLMGYSCPKCKGALAMVSEGRCMCKKCKHEFDPTIEFQKCSNCGGVTKLRVRKYFCKECGNEIISRFLFDGIVYNSEYFKQHMAESRQRKEEQRERVRQILASCRSDDLTLDAMDLNSVSGLIEALNSLSSNTPEFFEQEHRNEFDLPRYQNHVSACLNSEAIELRDIPPLINNQRLDLIWRFIAVIFLLHYGQVDVLQEGEEIIVRRHETY